MKARPNNCKRESNFWNFQVENPFESIHSSSEEDPISMQERAMSPLSKKNLRVSQHPPISPISIRNSFLIFNMVSNPHFAAICNHILKILEKLMIDTNWKFRQALEILATHYLSRSLPAFYNPSSHKDAGSEWVISILSLRNVMVMPSIHRNPFFISWW